MRLGRSWAISYHRYSSSTGTRRGTCPSQKEHLEIRRANELLQPFTSPALAEVLKNIDATARELRKSVVLNSREYSFAIFDESLVEELGLVARLDAKP